MKLTTKRDEQPKEVDRVVIYIGDVRYRLSESVDGKLTVNKYNEGELEKDSEVLKIFPRTGNEIEIQ